VLCAVEKSCLKISQCLAKVWTKVCSLLFGPPCVYYYYRYWYKKWL